MSRIMVVITWGLTWEPKMYHGGYIVSILALSNLFVFLVFWVVHCAVKDFLPAEQLICIKFCTVVPQCLQCVFTFWGHSPRYVQMPDSKKRHGVRN